MFKRFYTDIEQSRKLLSLGLRPETADMYYPEYDMKYSEYPEIIGCGREYYPDSDIPAWTFTALMRLMPCGADSPRLHKAFYTIEPKQMYRVEYYPNHRTKDYELPVDAAFEMVCYLIENKIIDLNKK